MKTKVTFLLLGTFISVMMFSSSRVHACSCAIQESVLEELEDSDTVFVGTVTDIEGTSLYSTENLNVDFSVEKIYKGSTDAYQTLKTPSDSAACGYNFEEGEKYLVFARAWGEDGDDEFTVSLCSLTQLFSEASEEIEDLEVAGGSRTPAPMQNEEENEENEGIIRTLMERLISLIRQLLAQYGR
ncbi:MAG: hypothetical protein AAB458_01330 [Patescibacteria group bacterium]